MNAMTNYNNLSTIDIIVVIVTISIITIIIVTSIIVIILIGINNCSYGNLAIISPTVVSKQT